MLGRIFAGVAAGFLLTIRVALAQPQLPEGDGKAVIQQACLGCHEPSRIVASGYNRQDWQNIVHMMLNVGAPVPSDKVAVLTDYLAENFPEKPRLVLSGFRPTLRRQSWHGASRLITQGREPSEPPKGFLNGDPRLRWPICDRIGNFGDATERTKSGCAFLGEGLAATKRRMLSGWQR